MFELKKLEEENNKRSVIEKLVDESTGYDKKYYESIKLIIDDIIKAKKYINMPTEKEEEIINRINSILN